MIDVKIGVKILSELKYFLTNASSDVNLLDVFRTNRNDFTRDRKLPFPRLVLMITKLCKRTLSLELEDFFDELGLKECCTVSAFTQQRSKLKSDFFYWWNIVLWESFDLYAGSNAKRWKGLRLVAADGSNVSLINNKALSSYFGGQRNQHDCFVQGKTFYYYDILNELVLYSRIAPYRYGETQMAYDGMRNLSDDMLLIYDRNFCSFKMFALHSWAEKEIKFIIRGNEHQRVIQEFIKSGKISSLVELSPSSSAIMGMKKSGFVITNKTRLKVRLVRVELEKSVEVLVTNLWQEEGHHSEEFKELYFKRWAVETNISKQKNILQLESFSGQTVESVKQDFYATVFITNLHSILTKKAQEEVAQNSSNRKHPMKINGNKSFGRLKAQITNLFTNNNPYQLLEILYTQFVKDTLPIRKNRSFKRIRKNKPGKSKHRTYSNYKPAY